MKKFCITFLLSGIIILTAALFGRLNSSQKTEEFLRIHIRADSNEEEAQEIKYLVRDEVVAYLTPLVCQAANKGDALALIEENLFQIERLTNEVLWKNGFSYTSKAALKKEEFPTRIYGEYTLPSGVYDSLILQLGEGAGNNWWCVVYPPLCFANTPDIRYRSLIWEKIESWRKNR